MKYDINELYLCQFFQITDIQGTEEADGGGTFHSSNEVEERELTDEEEMETDGRHVAMDGGRDAAAEKLSSSPYFSEKLTGFSMSSFTISGAVRPTKPSTNGATVAASRVIASSSSSTTTVSVVSNGIEESGVYENNPTNDVAAGDQSANTGPVYRVSFIKEIIMIISICYHLLFIMLHFVAVFVTIFCLLHF